MRGAAQQAAATEYRTARIFNGMWKAIVGFARY